MPCANAILLESALCISVIFTVHVVGRYLKIKRMYVGLLSDKFRTLLKPTTGAAHKRASAAYTNSTQNKTNRV